MLCFKESCFNLFWGLHLVMSQIFWWYRTTLTHCFDIRQDFSKTVATRKRDECLCVAAGSLPSLAAHTGAARPGFYFSKWQTAQILHGGAAVHMNPANCSLSSLYTDCPFPDSHLSLWKKNFFMSLYSLAFFTTSINRFNFYAYKTLQDTKLYLLFLIFCVDSVAFPLEKWDFPAEFNHTVMVPLTVSLFLLWPHK